MEEDAIKGESQTNGLAEVGVRIAEGIMRTLIIDVEAKIKTKISDSSVVMAWLAEHACTVYNRCTVAESLWQGLIAAAGSVWRKDLAEEVEEHR